jgi:hypothetical protein
MTVESVTERHEREGGDSSPLDKEGVLKRDRLVFHVVHSADTTKAAILDSTLVLQPKAPHPDGDLYMHVVDRSLRRVSPVLSELSIQFAAPELGLQQQAPNPLGIPPKIRYTTIKKEVEIDHTVAGHVIAFVTGEQPNPRVKEVVPIPLMSISRAVAFDPGDLIAEYTWAVNSDFFKGRAAGRLLIYDMEADLITSPEFSYWNLSVQIALGTPPAGEPDEDTWQTRVPALGLLIMVDDPLLPAPFPFPALKNGKPLGVPVPHDTTTGELDESAIGDASLQQWYTFFTKKQLPFSSLGLLI